MREIRLADLYQIAFKFNLQRCVETNGTAGLASPNHDGISLVFGLSYSDDVSIHGSARAVILQAELCELKRHSSVFSCVFLLMIDGPANDADKFVLLQKTSLAFQSKINQSF